MNIAHKPQHHYTQNHQNLDYNGTRISTKANGTIQRSPSEVQEMITSFSQPTQPMCLCSCQSSWRTLFHSYLWRHVDLHRNWSARKGLWERICEIRAKRHLVHSVRLRSCQSKLRSWIVILWSSHASLPQGSKAGRIKRWRGCSISRAKCRPIGLGQNM